MAVGSPADHIKSEVLSLKISSLAATTYANRVMLSDNGRACGSDDLRWEVSDDRLQENWLLLLSIAVHLVDLRKQLLVGLIANTLEDPVNGGLEQ